MVNCSQFTDSNYFTLIELFFSLKNNLCHLMYLDFNCIIMPHVLMDENGITRDNIILYTCSNLYHKECRQQCKQS